MIIILIITYKNSCNQIKMREITPILAFIDAHASQHKPREEAGIAEAPAGSLTSALY